MPLVCLRVPRTQHAAAPPEARSRHPALVKQACGARKFAVARCAHKPLVPQAPPRPGELISNKRAAIHQVFWLEQVGQAGLTSACFKPSWDGLDGPAGPSQRTACCELPRKPGSSPQAGPGRPRPTPGRLSSSQARIAPLAPAPALRDDRGELYLAGKALVTLPGGPTHAIPLLYMFPWPYARTPSYRIC